MVDISKPRSSHENRTWKGPNAFSIYASRCTMSDGTPPYARVSTGGRETSAITSSFLPGGSTRHRLNTLFEALLGLFVSALGSRKSRRCRPSDSFLQLWLVSEIIEIRPEISSCDVVVFPRDKGLGGSYIQLRIGLFVAVLVKRQNSTHCFGNSNTHNEER